MRHPAKEDQEEEKQQKKEKEETEGEDKEGECYSPSQVTSTIIPMKRFDSGSLPQDVRRCSGLLKSEVLLGRTCFN